MAISERDFSIIEKMAQYCTEIEEAHNSFDRSFASFKSSSLYRNAVCLCIMQIGELVNHLSDDFKNQHDDIPWRQIRGMRNIVAHEYGHVDVEVVWATATEGVMQIRQFCGGILDKSQNQDRN